MNPRSHFEDGLPEEPEKPQVNSFIVWFLIILPLGIAVGTGWGLYRYFGQEEEVSQKASISISSDEVSQILENYTKAFGDRGFETGEQQKQLVNVGKNLAGELQQQNSNMLSFDDRGGLEEGGRTWKTYWADIKGSKPDKVFCLVTSYDGKRNLRNAAKIAIMVTLAKSLAGNELDYTLRFVFVPKERDIETQEKWVESTCIAEEEKSLGMFFLAHGEGKAEAERSEDAWRIIGGNIPWAQELFKDTRVMSYGTATLHHGVFQSEQKEELNNVKRVENAAKGLRKKMIMILGGDR